MARIERGVCEWGVPAGVGGDCADDGWRSRRVKDGEVGCV
jgi:hypothetical protein